ncbi:MAG: 16S rRNA (guanine(966)-N(2))-methyltransferase RsmD [Kofleriaceae bacterium]|nr:16S rRNA (guanine(966)-N(2))-methyltransferase RsmD [Myxococcales bacterium]MCB9564624.1 16S rRNA (guanine(966)-N(2))-methyltransferase RsmD [Kofleriaceae bacterium]
MRIVGGQLGGRVLKAPAGSATRPTSERVREALFAILGPPPDDTRVLDLFAGSGALGLEALSRGAVDATFVDSGRPALAVLKANLAALGVTDRARVVASDVPAFLRRPPAAPWRWVFIDPPYRSDLARRALDALGAEGGSLTDDAVVVVEHDRRNPPLDRHGSLLRTDSRRYGDTLLALYRLEPEPPERP